MQKNNKSNELSPTPSPRPGTPHPVNNDNNLQNSDNLIAKDNVEVGAGSVPEATPSAVQNTSAGEILRC